MALELTNLRITPTRGNAALLPNQPILQGCVVSLSETATLVPGDIVALATGGADDQIVVKKAAVTDLPFGVVVGNAIATGFAAKDRVSLFVKGAYVYLIAGGSVARGAKVQFNPTTGKVDDTSTASNGYVGVALTAASADGDVIIVQVDPSI